MYIIYFNRISKFKKKNSIVNISQSIKTIPYKKKKFP